MVQAKSVVTGSDTGCGQVTATAGDGAGTVGSLYLLGAEGQAEETALRTRAS